MSCDKMIILLMGFGRKFGAGKLDNYQLSDFFLEKLNAKDTLNYNCNIKKMSFLSYSLINYYSYIKEYEYIWN